MRLRGNTSTDDWNPITLLWMMGRRECWHCGWETKEDVRKRKAIHRGFMVYAWYDGPMWHFFFGRFWIAICY